MFDTYPFEIILSILEALGILPEPFLTKKSTRKYSVSQKLLIS